MIRVRDDRARATETGAVLGKLRHNHYRGAAFPYIPASNRRKHEPNHASTHGRRSYTIAVASR
jgi:hypothetical protein